MSPPEMQTTGANRSSAEQIKEDSEIIGDAAPVDKRFATIAAQLALRGFALHRLTCGAFCITRWDRTAYAPDLAACRAFLDRVS